MITIETLRRFSLLAELDPAFLEQLSLISQDKAVAPGKWLFHEGDNADALYLILSGTVNLRLNLEKNRNIYVDLKTLGEGDTLGWSALVQPYRYSMGAMAATETHVVHLDGNQLRALVEAHPEQGYALMQGIAQAMATRLTTLSERAPGLSFRLVVSLALFTLGITALFILAVLGILAVGNTLGGRPQALDAIPVALFCLIFPATFLLLAKSIYPGGKSDNRLNDGV